MAEESLDFDNLINSIGNHEFTQEDDIALQKGRMLLARGILQEIREGIMPRASDTIFALGNNFHNRYDIRKITTARIPDHINESDNFYSVVRDAIISKNDEGSKKESLQQLGIIHHNMISTLENRRKQDQASSDHGLESSAPSAASATPPERTDSQASGQASQDGVDSATQFIPDDPELDRDELGRGVLAIVLGRRLHRIWCILNDAMPRGLAGTNSAAPRSEKSSADAGRLEHIENGRRDQDEKGGRAGFVVHLGAPWGGGKTTFANFVARVLNPYGFGRPETSFLHQRYPTAKNLGAIFLEDPPTAADANYARQNWPEDARRPWIIVPFNAWQMEHCTPPWWTFYQTIREHCLSAVRAEGTDAVELSAPHAPEKPNLMKRLCAWAWLVICEYAWRLSNPKVQALFSTAFISLAIMALLYYLNIIQLTPATSPQEMNQHSAQTPTFAVGNLIGLMFAGITTISALWGFATLTTESIMPGTDTLAERLSLGRGDPFDRFRRHFHNTMLRVRRPVMVIVDDLDRCSETFIVDIVRGIQTILRSSRVIFLILGDRDWIQQAFEAHYSSMSKVSVGPEQTLGARFVEKAFQMSFVLPDMRRDNQIVYLRWLLSRGQASAGIESVAALVPEAASELRRAIRTSAENSKASLVDTTQIREAISSASQSLSEAVTRTGNRGTRKQIEQFVNDEIAIRAATDTGVEAEISHLLVPVAPCLPPNPRQIKRIINAVTLYHAVALQQQGLDAADPRWVQLLLWVILMTEWPGTWRLIATFPAIIDGIGLSADDAKSKFKDIDPRSIPGSIEDAVKEIKRIQSDKALASLFIVDPDYLLHPVLDRVAVESFLPLTPLYGRKLQPKREDVQKEPVAV